MGQTKDEGRMTKVVSRNLRHSSFVCPFVAYLKIAMFPSTPHEAMKSARVRV